MPLPRQNKEYTVDDIYALPAGQRAELIEGQMYMMTPPGRKHQRIVLELSTTINNYMKRKGGACEVDIAPFAVFLNADDKNYVEPDISVICDRDKLTDRGCTGAPDWIIEIVSPGSRRSRTEPPVSANIGLLIRRKTGFLFTTSSQRIREIIRSRKL